VIRSEIGGRAREIGFDHLGICAADPGPETDLFRGWLEGGLHGAMGWMEKSAALRLDPSLLLRGARSILVGAVRYGPVEPPPEGPLSGEVSSYAWGEDYHRIVGAMAGALAAFIRTRYDARAVEYVDTGPVLERHWAAKSGVGWIGRNSLVLNRDSGSLIFLAVVLTDLEIPPDPPAFDQCGACTLCVEACPTGAILPDRTVDSRRCLSYHTIELRGEFPAGYRPALGSRLYGCDDCQTVCPWNQAGASRPVAPEFHPREGNARPDLVSVLAMHLPEYTERFRGSAMKRATYHGLRRNAAVALGNLLAESGISGAGAEKPSPADEDRRRAIMALKAAARDPEPAVSDAAARVLRALGEDPA